MPGAPEDFGVANPWHEPLATILAPQILTDSIFWWYFKNIVVKVSLTSKMKAWVESSGCTPSTSRCSKP